MKKTILSAAILLASTFGFTAMAQTQQNSVDQVKTEKAKSRQGKQMNRANPFEGLNLTEQQQSELKAIAPAKPERKAKDNATQANAAKCKKSGKCTNDSTVTKADKQKIQAERRQNMLQSRRDYLAKVKDILTPEQYVQFLENSYVDKAFKNGAKRGMMAKANKRGNKGKGSKAMRGNKPAKQQNGNDNNSAFYIDNGKIKVFPYQAQR